MAATSYFYSLLFLLFAAVISVVCQIKKSRLNNPLYIVTIFTLFGIMVYVMVFEANNRQLYNHVPWFAIGAVIGVEGITSLLKNIVIRKNEW